MKLENFFRRHPVFTGEEMTAFLASEGPRNSRTQEALLVYHVKTGRLVRVRRGLYAVVPPGASAETYPVDPFLLASRMTKDAVLAYHTAMEFHGKAYSVYEHFTYLAAAPSRPVTYRSNQFKGVGFSKSLSLKDGAHFDVVKTDRSGLEVRVTGLERTFVDVL
ncbi:MAG: type IV toxin-antitoxin system AbiEi family antitoxin domain-containing protein, partial [Deltaproteobacteria bacterium]|nr:type IV toxin-antitoxin system AbiEi family antitoxin domain-containing protein [Deltaproteobacteria bacterium]